MARETVLEAVGYESFPPEMRILKKARRCSTLARLFIAGDMFFEIFDLYELPPYMPKVYPRLLFIN